ncbi:hypothetical protein HK405_003677, partial [Cladochytrium tenue]
TAADVIVQAVGARTRDGRYGEVFAANLLGHYIMLRELEPLLARVAQMAPALHEPPARSMARVIWTGSTSATQSFFNEDDFQCLEGEHPYESAKFLVDRVSHALGPALREKGICSYLSNPGILVSGITQGQINSTLLLVLMLILRLFGLVGVNIWPATAATAVRFLLSHPEPSRVPQDRAYFSDVGFPDRRRVITVPVASIDSPDTDARILAKLEGMWLDERERAGMPGRPV